MSEEKYRTSNHWASARRSSVSFFLLKKEQFRLSFSPSGLDKLWMYLIIYFYHRHLSKTKSLIYAIFIGLIIYLPLIYTQYTIPLTVVPILSLLSFIMIFTYRIYTIDLKKFHSFSKLANAVWFKKLTLNQRLFFCQQMNIGLEINEITNAHFFATGDITIRAEFPRETIERLRDTKKLHVKDIVDLFGFRLFAHQTNHVRTANWILFLFDHPEYEQCFEKILKDIYPTEPPNEDIEKNIYAKLATQNGLSKLKPFLEKYETYLRSCNVATDKNFLLTQGGILLQPPSSYNILAKHFPIAQQIPLPPQQQPIIPVLDLGRVTAECYNGYPRPPSPDLAPAGKTSPALPPRPHLPPPQASSTEFYQSTTFSSGLSL